MSLAPAEPSTRPKRLRKRKKFFNEENETVVKRRRLKKKSVVAVAAPPLFTDAEIEEQFGERLSPTVKNEPVETAQSHVVIEIEPVPQTPIERARSKLLNALERKISTHRPRLPFLSLRSFRRPRSRYIPLENPFERKQNHRSSIGHLRHGRLVFASNENLGEDRRGQFAFVRLLQWKVSL